MRLAARARRFTAFTTHMGLFEFNFMPFGLCNAGASFQRAMEKLLRTVREFAQAYIDDISIASKTFENHLEHIDQVLKIIIGAKMKLKAKKCSFGFKQMKFLGFIVSEKGIEVCKEKSECIRNYPRPKTTKNVKQLVGVGSYYRKFI